MGPTANNISASTNDQIIEELENKTLQESSGLKRKRGRPKKDLNVRKESPLELLHEPSTSGILGKRNRKKTKILSESDGSEMEDSLASIQNSLKESYSSEQRGECVSPAMKRKRGRPRKNKGTTMLLESHGSGMDKSLAVFHNTINESSELNKNATIKKQAGGSQKKLALKEVPIQIGSSSCEAGTSSNIDDASNDGKVIESDSVPKNSTTLTMLNQVFKGFLGKRADGNSEGPDNEVVRRKGRLPLNVDSLLDKSGESICMVCNATIPNLQWINHKREEHYNLTWRKGNPAMDILDPSVIQNSLKQLLEEQQYLKCKKCKKTHNTVKLFVAHLELCEGVVNSEGRVRCAICSEELEKGKWALHRYKKHNNLAWRIGDTPLNLEDRDLVMKILTSLYKSKKPFFCELCGKQKKSVVGYLSHKGVCQWSGLNAEQAKITCELCGRKMLPVSMDSHMKVHNKAQAARKAYNDEIERIEVEELGPRRAALQALQVIETMKDEGATPKLYTSEPNFNDASIVRQLKKSTSSSQNFSCIFTGCPFITTSIDDTTQHLEQCDKKPDLYYLCKVCLTWTLTETVIVEHINKSHNKVKEADAEFSFDGENALEDEDDIDDKDGESERLYDEFEKKRRLLRLKAKSSVFESDYKVIPPLFLANTLKWDYPLPQYPQAYNWTFNFCDKFYTDLPVFDSHRNKTSWQVLDGDILNEYLPINYESYSIAIVTCNSAGTDVISGNLEFTKLDLFEARLFHRDEATIFCGGPITSLAWLPTPHNQINKDQILAVSILNDSGKEYLVGQIYREPCVVQFWNFGILSYEQEIVTPFLLCGLALNTGPVWHLEWCPSGCFDNVDTKKTHRLGLLAVATSDSFVYIYSIDNVAEEGEKGLIYKGDPVLKLRLEDGTTSLDHEYYATRISWSKVKGHKYVAVGYSSGLLAIYNLSSTNLFDRRARIEIYNAKTVFPYLTFQAHYSCITGLSLLHYGDGNRYCFSTSLDKQSIYWDLFKQTKIFSQRKHATEGMWLTNWPVALQPEDETHFFAGYANTFSNPLRDVINTGSSVFSYSGSGINTVCFNDWLNLIVQGGNAGEVMGMFAHKMFSSTDKRKKGKYRTNRRKAVFTGTKMVRKEHLADGVADNNIDAQRDSYNIVFIDYSFEKLAKNDDTANCVGAIISSQQYSSDQYPLLAIRKVATNPNREACMFYATGHQSGFLRIRKIDCLGPRFGPKTFNDSACVESL